MQCHNLACKPGKPAPVGARRLVINESSRVTWQGVVGVNLGDRRRQICRIDQESGAILEEARLTTTAASFQRALTGLAPHLVVLESGTHSLWVARLVKQLGHQVIVANPGKVQAVSASRRKTDERDARCLAQLARVDPELLSPVHPRSEEAQQALAVVRAREGLVRSRTKLINQVRGTVKAFGARLPASSTSSFARRAQEALPQELKAAVGPPKPSSKSNKVGRQTLLAELSPPACSPGTSLPACYQTTSTSFNSTRQCFPTLVASNRSIPPQPDHVESTCRTMSARSPEGSTQGLLTLNTSGSRPPRSLTKSAKAAWDLIFRS